MATISMSQVVKGTLQPGQEVTYGWNYDQEWTQTPGTPAAPFANTVYYVDVVPGFVATPNGGAPASIAIVEQSRSLSVASATVTNPPFGVPPQEVYVYRLLVSATFKNTGKTAANYTANVVEISP